MKVDEILVLISLCSVVSISFSFTTNRTEWNLVPQLTPRQKTSAEVLMKDVRVEAIGEALRTSESKQLLDNENVTKKENLRQELRFNDTGSNLKAETKNLIIDLLDTSEINEKTNKSFLTRRNENEPLNVILLIVKGKSEQLMDVFNEQSPFPVMMSLQSCPKISMIEMLLRKSTCDCNSQLKANIMSLLSWAQHEKGMCTSVMYDMPMIYVQKIESEMSFANPQESLISSISEIKGPNEPINDEKLWHVANILSQMRKHFLRDLLNSRLNTVQDKQIHFDHPNIDEQQEASLRRSNFHNLATNVLEELNSMPNERGYLLVASPHVKDIPNALLIPASSNTLVVATSTCQQDDSPIWLYARGPSSSQLSSFHLEQLADVPNAIRDILDFRPVCTVDSECRPTTPAPADLSMAPQLEPLLIYDEMPRFELPISGRFARDQQRQMEEMKTSEVTTKDENEITNTSIENKESTLKPLVTTDNIATTTTKLSFDTTNVIRENKKLTKEVNVTTTEKVIDKRDNPIEKTLFVANSQKSNTYSIKILISIGIFLNFLFKALQ